MYVCMYMRDVYGVYGTEYVLWVHVRVCMYAYMYVCDGGIIIVRVCFVCACACMYVCMYVCMFVMEGWLWRVWHRVGFMCVCVYVCMHACMYVCMYVTERWLWHGRFCVCICMCVCFVCVRV